MPGGEVPSDIDLTIAMSRNRVKKIGDDINEQARNEIREWVA